MNAQIIPSASFELVVWLVEAFKKKYGIIWEFFPTWGGVFSIPKTQNQKKVPLNHPKITQKTYQIFHKITQKISFWTKRSQKGVGGVRRLGKIPK